MGAEIIIPEWFLEKVEQTIENTTLLSREEQQIRIVLDLLGNPPYSRKCESYYLTYALNQAKYSGDLTMARFWTSVLEKILKEMELLNV